jgi:hypothetical protein
MGAGYSVELTNPACTDRQDLRVKLPTPSTSRRAGSVAPNATRVGTLGARNQNYCAFVSASFFLAKART